MEYSRLRTARQQPRIIEIRHPNIPSRPNDTTLRPTQTKTGDNRQGTKKISRPQPTTAAKNTLKDNDCMP